MGWNFLSIPKLQRHSRWNWGWISNFIPLLFVCVITYPWSWTMLAKFASGMPASRFTNLPTELWFTIGFWWNLLIMSSKANVSALLALCEGNPSVTGGFPSQWPVDSPHTGQWRRDLIFSLICAWTNIWANNRDAGDMRRHSALYAVTVMWLSFSCWSRYTPCKQMGAMPNPS